MAVRAQTLLDLPKDAAARAETLGGVLRDVGDAIASHLPDDMARSLREFDVAERDRPSSYACAQAGVAEEGHRDRCLAAAGLAHETEHLAAMQIEVDAVDDVDAALDHLNAQAADAEDRARAQTSRPRTERPRACEVASAKRLMPIAKTAMAIAGGSTVSGAMFRPTRFSLIMTPQFGSGGLRPMPR